MFKTSEVGEEEVVSRANKGSDCFIKHNDTLGLISNNATKLARHWYRMCDTVSMGKPHLQAVDSFGKNLDWNTPIGACPVVHCTRWAVRE
jgi:hypothetical protein